GELRLRGEAVARLVGSLREGALQIGGHLRDQSDPTRHSRHLLPGAGAARPDTIPSPASPEGSGGAAPAAGADRSQDSVSGNGDPVTRPSCVPSPILLRCHTTSDVEY